MFELRPADESRLAAPGEVDGPPDAQGIRRTPNRLAAGAAAPGRRMTSTPTTPGSGMRGRRGRDRRSAESGARTAGGPGSGAGRRLPDLSALPPLLTTTGSFASLRERLAAPRRHVGLTSIPHGAKSFLAAAIAIAEDGERLVWIARDAEIGDRVAEELQAWLGRRGCRRRPRAADRARLRAERARRRRDRGPRRRAERLAERPGADPRRGRPGPRPAHDRAGRPAGRAAPAR